MGFTAEMERDFVKKDLGPTLVANGYKDVKLMMLDDNRLFVSVWANTILSDPNAKKFISGKQCLYFGCVYCGPQHGLVKAARQQSPEKRQTFPWMPFSL